MTRDIHLLKDIRKLTSKVLDKLSDEQLLKIPEGFNNNILWNAGHMLVSQQGLTYGLSGQAQKVSKEMVQHFKRGSSPANWDETPDIGQVKTLLIELPEQFEKDYQQGLFDNYHDYETALGTVLTTIDEAVSFNSFHEGLHFGTILTMRKLV